jgi:RHS repeat-associated protein
MAKGIGAPMLVLCAGMLASPAWAISVSLTSPSSSVIAAPATITLSASATPGTGRRILRVDFFRGTTRIGTDSSAPYSIVWSNVPLGNYILTAVAIDSGGSVAVSEPVAIRVDNPPSVSLTAPASGTVFAPGTNIAVTAAVGDSDGVIRKVEFFAGSTLIGTQFLAPYEIRWNGVPAGTYSLTARATDLAGLVSVSAPVRITLDTAPTVAITAPAAGADFDSPATITVSATASDSDGTVAKVEFFDGTTLVGTGSTVPGSSTYSVTLNGVAAGTHVLTARATDDQGVTASSRAVSVIVRTAVVQTYYIHTDHLNTPRMIADQIGTTVWQWDNTEPCGNSLPNDDPDGDGVPFVFDLRFPGQYFDRETGLSYNYFRDYDPAIGRYVESDPIGLDGGANTYSYVNSNPSRFSDPKGKSITWMGLAAGGLAIYGGYSLWKSFDDKDRCAKECMVTCNIARCGREDPTDDTNEPRCRNACIPQCVLNTGPKKGPTGPQPPTKTPDYIR